MLGKISAGDISKYSCYFLSESRHYHFKQTICLKCRSLISGKNKKKKNKKQKKKKKKKTTKKHMIIFFHLLNLSREWKRSSMLYITFPVLRDKMQCSSRKEYNQSTDSTALRKQAYSHILKISTPKNDFFSDKNSDSCHNPA